jgi:hypothetical protein
MFVDGLYGDERAENMPEWHHVVADTLRRRLVLSVALPLPVVAAEIRDWVCYARPGAWSAGDNFRSLLEDLNASAAMPGPVAAATIASEVDELRAAYEALRPARDPAPDAAARSTDPVWARVAVAADALTGRLRDEEVLAAAWADVRDAAEHAPADVVELHLRLAFLDSVVRQSSGGDDLYSRIGSVLVSVDGHEGGWRDAPSARLTASEREQKIDELLAESVESGELIVWLGYANTYISKHVVGGPIETFWAPTLQRVRENIEVAGLPRLDELQELASHDYLFKQAENAHDLDRLEVLFRVDLGTGPYADAFTEAETLVDVIIDAALLHGGGLRPRLVEAVLLSGGKVRSMNMRAGRPAPFNDYTGKGQAGDSIARYLPVYGPVLTNLNQRGFLSEALRAHRDASATRSREAAFGHERMLDDRTVFALVDRVLEHISSDAGFKPGVLTERLSAEWPYLRWLDDMSKAVHLAIRVEGMYKSDPDAVGARIRGRHGEYVLTQVAEHADELVALLDSHWAQPWVEHMLSTLVDPTQYRAELQRHEGDSELLRARHRRIRNAVVHGNPATDAAIESVAAYSSFLADYAMQLGLNALGDGTTVDSLLAVRDTRHADLRLNGPLSDGGSAAADPAA